MSVTPKLTTIAACRVAELNRDRFNEYVASGSFRCAPPTVPGRARLFTPDDLLALVLFKQLMDDEVSPARAGSIACMVAKEAAACPDEAGIAFLETFIGVKRTMPASQLTPASEWPNVLDSGSMIRKVSIFNVHDLRIRIAHRIEEERSIIGPDDDTADPVREARERYHNGLITRDEFLSIVEQPSE